MSCPPHATLEALARGALSADEAGPVRSHTLDCEACGAVLEALEAVPSSRPDRPERLGRYVIVSVLGEGGMGRVYKAYDPQLDRKTALKVLRPDQAGDPSGRARLVREARAMARLVHPNIVQLFDAGEDQGQVFIAMELVDGPSLDGWLARGPHAPREVVRVFLQAARGLLAAHEAGLVHRDFKPSNVLLKDGVAKVTDFGLARSAGSTAVSVTPSAAPAPHGLATDGAGAPSGAPSVSDPTPMGDQVTQAGVLGTPAYMAPEQRLGQVDARSDQYAFGVSLHEALHGARPGAAKAPGREVPRWLDRVVQRMVSPAPEDRYPGFREVVAALEDDPAPGRRQRLVLLGGVALVGLLLVLALRTTGQARCDGAEARQRAVFSPERRSRLMARAPAQGEDVARATRLAVRQFEDFGAAWATAQTNACEATRRGAQSDQLYTLQTLCFDRALSRWDAVVTAAETLEPGPEPREAVEALTALGLDLPDLSTCQDKERLAQQATGESIEQQRAALPLRRSLDEVMATASAGRVEAASQALEPLVRQARQLGNEAVLAEVLTAKGQLELRIGTTTAAEQVLLEAYQSAARARNDETAAEAMVELMVLLSRDPASLRAMRQLAEAAIDRTGRSPRWEAMLAYRVGRAAFNLGDYAVCTEAYRRAFELRKAELGLEHLETLWTLTNLSACLVRSGKVAEGVEVQRQQLEVTRRLWGPDALNTLEAEVDYASQLVAARRDAEALPLLSTALERLTAAKGSDVSTFYSLHDNLAFAFTHLGQLDRARQHRDELLLLARRAFPDHPHFFNALAASGDVALLQGDVPRALAETTAAIEGLTKSNPDHSELPWALATQAQALVRSNRPAEARAAIERALVIAASPSEARAVALLAGACVLRPSPRAASLAEEAEAWFLGQTGFGAEAAVARTRRAVATEALPKGRSGCQP